MVASHWLALSFGVSDLASLMSKSSPFPLQTSAFFASAFFLASSSKNLPLSPTPPLRPLQVGVFCKLFPTKVTIYYWGNEQTVHNMLHCCQVHKNILHTVHRLQLAGISNNNILKYTFNTKLLLGFCWEPSADQGRSRRTSMDKTRDCHTSFGLGDLLILHLLCHVLVGVLKSWKISQYVHVIAMILSLLCHKRFPVLVQVMEMILNLKLGLKIHNPCTSPGISILKKITNGMVWSSHLSLNHPQGRWRGWQSWLDLGILKSPCD